MNFSRYVRRDQFTCKNFLAVTPRTLITEQEASPSQASQTLFPWRVHHCFYFCFILFVVKFRSDVADVSLHKFLTVTIRRYELAATKLWGQNNMQFSAEPTDRPTARMLWRIGICNAMCVLGVVWRRGSTARTEWVRGESELHSGVTECWLLTDWVSYVGTTNQPILYPHCHVNTFTSANRCIPICRSSTYDLNDWYNDVKQHSLFVWSCSKKHVRRLWHFVSYCKVTERYVCVSSKFQRGIFWSLNTFQKPSESLVKFRIADANLYKFFLRSCSLE